MSNKPGRGWLRRYARRLIARELHDSKRKPKRKAGNRDE